MGETDAKPEDPISEEQNPDGPTIAVAVVLKLNLHCQGCAEKLKRSIRNNFQGVEEVTTDLDNNKLTVKGKVDPINLRQKLEKKTGRKVELLSPLPISPLTGDKKPEDPSEKKSDQSETKEEEEEKPTEIKVVLKIRLHCEGCINKIKRIIKKYNGVNSINFEPDKNLVNVVGVIDENALVTFLSDKLKRSVQIIPTKEESEKHKNETTDQEGKVGNHSQKEAKVETKKMEYYEQGYNSYYAMPVSNPISHGYYYGEGYDPNQGYEKNDQYSESLGPYGAFSDENPNASCYIM